jgi:hypothetical protein
MFALPSSRLRRRTTGVGLIALLIGLLLAFSSGASADEMTDLRDGVPTGIDVRSQIDELSRGRDDLLVLLNAAETNLIDTFTDRNNFNDEQRRLTIEIELAIEHLRTVAVRAFVTGGDVSELALLNLDDVSDVSWRRHLLRTHAGSQQVAVDRLRALEAQASDEVRDSIERAESLRLEIDQLQVEIPAIESLLADTRAIQPLADAWDRAAIAIEEGAYGIAPEEKWENLRFCESTDNYRATSPTGKYRGAYQFDFATWRTVGGTGDPAAALPAEQDARARELYARRGHQPWECGSHLE